MRADFDPRIHLFRSDAAASYLRGRVSRDHYFDASTATCIAPKATVYEGPSESDPRVNELLFGEQVNIYEQTDGWAWIQSLRDDSVGYCREAVLTQKNVDANASIIVPWALVYPEPDFKREPISGLPFMSCVNEVDRKKSNRPTNPHIDFSLLKDVGWVPTTNLTSGFLPKNAIVDLASNFCGAPYLWGGKTFYGIDCSGLVQIVFRSMGIKFPRNTDYQRAFSGAEEVPKEQYDNLEIGDLIFLPRHVAIHIGGGTCIHADGIDMVVHAQPLDQILQSRKMPNLDSAFVSRVSYPSMNWI